MLTDQSALVRFSMADFAPAAPVLAAPLARSTALQPAARSFTPGFARPRSWRDAPALVASAAAVALLFSAMVWMNVAGEARKQHRVVTVDLTMTPPAAPKPREAKPAEPQQARLQPAPAPQAVPQTPVAAPLPAVALAQSAPAPVAAPVAAPAPAPAPAAAPAAPAGPVEGGDMTARMVSFVAPTYPLESRRLREEGTVVLSLLLGTSGRVDEISVSASSGSPRLDKAALDAVRKWRWAPVMRGGEPVMVRGTVKIPFAIRH